MRRLLSALAFAGLALSVSSARADGILMPVDRSLPPLSLTYERVHVTIDGQVATTAVEQVYRNSTDRDLEADYLFPLPAGASVREFAMWVGGKRLTGETVEAAKARKTYEDIVRRLQDPGLLEFVGCDLWKVRIYPVPRHGEQKIEIKFTTLLPRDGDMIAYLFPLKTGKTPRQTTGDFTLMVDLTGAEAIGPIYSPSHDVAINRKGDRQAVVSFERNGYTLDKDFTLYFAPKSKSVGLSLLAQRDSRDSRGYFLLLLSPRAEGQETSVPRDLVVVLDTSSSMSAEKIRQAKGALRYALETLKPEDRFSLIQFATVVTPFREGLRPASSENLAEARSWLEKLEAQGATDIGSALEEALRLRPSNEGGRTFQVLFLTDGLPTVGRTDPKSILESVKERNSQSTRIFTFGVGDDVNAHLLDELAETTRAASTYVRPSEDLEVKASALMAKIRYPVRTDLKLKVSERVRLVEMYPPHLPDLFRGEQLQVAGRFEGDGHVALTLESRVGDRSISESYDADFPESATGHDFIAPIWARRKVGYLLDQIRLHGESSEPRDEVIRLAREFGIATPYTSLLIVPDLAPLASAGGLFRGLALQPAQLGQSNGQPAEATRPFHEARSQPGQQDGQGRLLDRARSSHFGLDAPGTSASTALKSEMETPRAQAAAPATEGAGPVSAGAGDIKGQNPLPASKPESAPVFRRYQKSRELSRNGALSKEMLEESRRDAEKKAPGFPPAGAPVAARPHAEGLPATAPSGKAAIDLAERLAGMKKEGRLEEAQAVRTVAGRRFRLIEDTWVDDRFDPSARTLKLKALGTAYFRLLERHPELKTILALGGRVLWVSPSGTVLVVDQQGEEEASDATLDGLFRSSKGG